MPHKNPQQKWEWERRHRTQRVARRRELRRIEAARQAAQPAQPEAGISGAAFILPMIAGGVLAAHNPMLAMGAGGLTVFVAAAHKKDWRWWVVGILLLALAQLLTSRYSCRVFVTHPRRSGRRSGGTQPHFA